MGSRYHVSNTAQPSNAKHVGAHCPGLADAREELRHATAARTLLGSRDRHYVHRSLPNKRLNRHYVHRSLPNKRLNPEYKTLRSKTFVETEAQHRLDALARKDDCSKVIGHLFVSAIWRLQKTPKHETLRLRTYTYHNGKTPTHNKTGKQETNNPVPSTFFDKKRAM